MDTTPLTPDPRGGERHRADRRQDPAPLASTDRRASQRDEAIA
jgi:hypothetical protein